ncbi:Peptidase M14 like family protein [Spironucleus salmonicida]|uniref:Peptidase M14 like family protein n=1 Tax=Spironucleus salmonicida TaxID=348837 RepID=V6LYA1_9EUKA|nr:Peptidase M14 like family protein [Spironucleus salmonicida]|eukprot:EST48676.1 Peptidase M14-like domain protein [Spironucleus salmonicida]
MQKQDLIQTLLTRGDHYSVADSIIANAKLPQPMPTQDGRDQLPKLDYLKGQTFQHSQAAPGVPAPKLAFQPLILPPQQLKVPIDSPQMLLNYPNPELAESHPAVTFSDQEPYKKQESLELLQKTKKILIFHSLLNIGAKPFSLKLSNAYKVESRFETANLFAIYANGTNFDILLRPDLTTSNHQMSFAFAISGLKQGSYTFKVNNLLKPLKQPFQPLIFTDKYSRIGSEICCYSGSFQRKTPYFYLDAMPSVGLAANGFRVQEMSEFKQQQVNFKNFLKKSGLMQKSGKLKKGVEISYNAPGNYYCYIFKFEVQADQEIVYFSSQLNCSYGWILNKLQQINTKILQKGVKIEMLSYCRSYFGNQVPLVKIYQYSEKDKKSFLILSKTSPQDNSASFALTGFINDLLCEYDGEYQEQIEKANEKEKIQLKIWYNKHLQQRQILLNTYVFYVLPVYAVDGTISGNCRTDNFGINFQKFFHEEGNYRTPQQVLFNQFIKEIRADFLLDLRSSTSIQKWKIDQISIVNHQPIKMKIWEIFGNLGIVPKLPQEVLTRMFQERRSKAFITSQEQHQQQRPPPDEVPLIEIDKKFVSLEVEKQIYEYCLQNKQYFVESSLFSFCKKFPNFDYEQSTTTGFNPEEQYSNIRYIVNKYGGKAYTVYIPSFGDSQTQYCVKDFQTVGRNILEFIEFLHNTNDLQKIREDISEEYSKWVNAAILATIGKGLLAQVDIDRYSDSVKQQLPDQLKTYAQMTDRERYEILIDFNENVDYREALDLNKQELAGFDSDDSVNDNELDIKVTKETDEQKVQRLEEMKIIKDLFDTHFPVPPKKKSKKGKKGKNKK